MALTDTTFVVSLFFLLLLFCIHFKSICSRSVIYTIGILVGIALHLQIALGIMDNVYEYVSCTLEKKVYSQLSWYKA